MYNRYNPSDTRMKSEIIICVLILLVLSMLQLSCSDGEESGHDKPFVYLNHVYVCLDSTTYYSVCNSELLKEKFAYVETRTTYANTEDSWTGTYIWGENTYIEFFDIGNIENPGWSGIGYGVETEHGIDSLYSRFTNAGIDKVAKGLRTRKVEDVEIPWFYWFGFSNEDLTAKFVLNTWLMEYHNDYMKHKYPDIDPESINITRKLYNKNYYKEDLLLKNIIEIELALAELDYNKLFEELKNLGYQMERKGERAIARGPDITIILRAKYEDKSGLCRIKFSLTDKQYDPQTVQFGDKSRLILNVDKTAEWYFAI